MVDVEALIKSGMGGKGFLAFHESEIEVLKKHADKILEHKDEIIGSTLQLVLSDEAMASSVRNGELGEEEYRKILGEWFEAALRGPYDYSHAADVVKTGLRYTKAGISERLMVLSMGVLMTETLKVLKSEKLLEELAIPFVKACMWNLAIMVQAFTASRIASFGETTGMSPELIERMIKLSANKVHSKALEDIEKRKEGRGWGGG